MFFLTKTDISGEQIAEPALSGRDTTAGAGSCGPPTILTLAMLRPTPAGWSASGAGWAVPRRLRFDGADSDGPLTTTPSPDMRLRQD